MVDKPKILILDIETAPAKAYIWRLFDENIGLDQLIEPSRIICWGAKWHNEKEMAFEDERSGRRYMLFKLAALLDKADAVVHYNGDKFDMPKILGEMIRLGLSPPPPVASIDLIKTVRKLGLQSNKLAFVAPYFGIGEKIRTDFRLWLGVMRGDEKAWDKMKRYNLTDIRRTAALYTKLRPYITNHPYLVTPGTKPQCSKCGSTHVHSRGHRYTKTMAIDRLQCQKPSCRAWTDGTRHRIKK